MMLSVYVPETFPRRNRTIVVSPFGLTEPLNDADVLVTADAALVAAVGNVGGGNVVKFSSLPSDEPCEFYERTL